MIIKKVLNVNGPRFAGFVVEPIEMDEEIKIYYKTNLSVSQTGLLRTSCFEKENL